MHRFLASFLTLTLVILLNPYISFAEESTEAKFNPNRELYVVQITWGKTDYENNLNNTSETLDFSGNIKNNGRIFVEETLRFEETDRVLNTAGNQIAFKSKIYNGVDGLILNMAALPDSSFTITNNFFGEKTVSFKQLVKNGKVRIND